MLYAWKENSMRTNCLAACAYLTITVSEIERNIGRKSSFLIRGKMGNGKVGNGKLGNRKIRQPFFGGVGKVGNGKMGNR